MNNFKLLPKFLLKTLKILNPIDLYCKNRSNTYTLIKIIFYKFTGLCHKYAIMNKCNLCPNMDIRKFDFSAPFIQAIISRSNVRCLSDYYWLNSKFFNQSEWIYIYYLIQNIYNLIRDSIAFTQNKYLELTFP